MQTHLDHLVIAAESLTQGVDYVRDTLGVDMPFGGVHHSMGTHNHLMQLGGDVFLEIIAINPAGPQPQQPRWYGLDDPLLRQQIARQPALLTYVVNTDDIMQLTQQATVPAGVAQVIHRDNLSWYFAVPEDGRLLAAGFLPYLIQWQTEQHPARQMADLDCQLRSLEIHHPNAAWLSRALQAIAAEQLVDIIPAPSHSAPQMIATIETPNGIKKLHSASQTVANPGNAH